MNFATLQGLTIPEGVVTQITDASGRVIWSAGPKIVYLRPSADISLEHPVYPTTLTAGYLAISEEVSDGTASYIGYTEPLSSYAVTSKFKMTLDEPSKIGRILSAKFIFAGKAKNHYIDPGWLSAECSCVVFVDNVEVFSGETSIYGDGGNSDVDTLSNADMPNLVSALNSYISANGAGSFPEVLIEIYNYTSGSHKGDKTTSYAPSYVSQVAIEIECG